MQISLYKSLLDPIGVPLLPVASTSKNHVYPSQLERGQRLLRLHCPLPSGQWTGAWSNGSNEWSHPSMQGQISQFSASLEDDATFWISYE